MLAREFMRLTALEALRPSALLDSNGPWPTIAGLYVSDSRIDPIDDVNAEERRPLIGVYTEDTRLTKIAQSGASLYRGEVDLVFEISVVSGFTTDGGVIVDYADTDAATEATLGSLEDQIFHCLHYAPSGALFRKMVKLPFDGWHSAVKRSGEEAIKLAARTIVAKVNLREVCYAGSPASAATDFDRLPAALKRVAQQLHQSSYLHDLALGMARVAPQMPVSTPLESIATTVTRSSDGMVFVGPAIDNLSETQ